MQLLLYAGICLVLGVLYVRRAKRLTWDALVVVSLLMAGLGSFYLFGQRASAVPTVKLEQARQFHTLELIVVNDGLSNSEADMLLHRLQGVFSARIVAKRVTVELEEFYGPGRQKLQGERLLSAKSIFADEPGGVYRIALLPGDMYGGGFNYLFSQTEFSNMRTVIALERLRLKQAAVDRSTVELVYKLILRRVGIMGGLISSDCGPMSFARSRRDLDAKPDEYCPQDSEALRRLNVIRERPE